MLEGTSEETSETLVAEMAHTNTRDVDFVAVVGEGDTFGSRGLRVEGEASDSLAFVVQKRVPEPLMPSQSVSESETHERVVCTRNDTGHVFPSV